MTGRLHEWWREVRLACRSLRATPVAAAVAILSLALGIGANTAIFSIINGLLLRALPVKEPARLALLTDTSPSHVRVWSYAVWKEIEQRPELFASSAAWSLTRFNLASGGETELVDGMWASGSLFETLGVPALVGRTFGQRDDRSTVAVISSGFSQRRFGGSREAIGRTIAFDGVAFTIVGVMPPVFSGPEIGRAFDVIVPLETEPLVRGRDSLLSDTGITFLTIIARLRPGQQPDGAAAALRAVQPAIRDATLGDIGRFGSRAAIDRYLAAPFVLAPGASGYSGARDLRGVYERPLLTIMAVVILLLLIGCVNVANVLTARAAARRHELSLRVALGASRWGLARQLLAESAVLSAVGTAFGLGLAWWSGPVLVGQLSNGANAVVLDLSVDRRFLAFTAAIAAATTIIFGVVPALRASRAAPIDALKHNPRAIGGPGDIVLTGWLIIVQVAISLVLVAAAGLFVRSFTALAKRPLGFQPAPVLIVNLDAHRTTDEAAGRIALYERARAAVGTSPDVAEAALSLTTPVGAGQFTPRVDIDGVADTHGPVWGNLISPRWFATLQIPILGGRDLGERDRAGTPRVAVVNEAFARKFAAGGNPIGRTFTLYPHTPRTLGPIEIVGVAGDAVYSSLRDPAPPTFYLPLAQFDYLTELGIRAIALSVRSRAGSPAALTKTVATALASVNPQLALTFRTLPAQVNAALAQERLMAMLAGSFAALALLLAGVGLYGVVACAVASRRIEIGIRIALGAPAGGVIRLVAMRTALLIGIGLVVGLATSWWAATFVGSLVYGLQPRDPIALVNAAALLTAVAGLAAWLPTRRALRIDPAAVLREN